MKKIIYIATIGCLVVINSCKKLDISPQNIIQDPDIFTTTGGIDAYMARIYGEMPIEDFRYCPNMGLNFFWIINPTPAITGEALSRDQTNAQQENFDNWKYNNNFWGFAYHLIRECNYFEETIPTYASNFDQTQVNNWLGEARMIRGVTYLALVKRFGGVPIVDSVLTEAGESISQLTETIDELKIPRSSEETVWNQVGTDLDFAYKNLPETNTTGRATKYAAAAFKSRAMLYAGSIAKYNQINLTAGGSRLCGISADKAVTYFKAAYDAAKLLDGHYSLYKKSWAVGDKEAQYQNYVNLFFDETSPENVFVRQYHYPESVHGYDAYNVPRQLIGGNGYSSEVNPTLNFVEMFDGIPKNDDGTIKVLDATGKYNLYDNTMQLFDTAEPRLRATVILPGDIFKNESIEIRRGIYTGSITGGISKLLPAGSTANYPTDNLITSSTASQTPYTLPDGTQMNPAGASGVFTGDGTCAISGFSVRKWLVPDLPTANVLENHSDQTWIEIRYAEVMLNEAEAAYELYSAGQGATYLTDALNLINQIRDRAGTYALASITLSDVRNERRKELSFENKTWWDLRRWHIADKEQNGTLYKILMPFYAAQAKKYFFDSRLDERNDRYTFDTRWYYEQIQNSTIATSTNIIQNPGY